MSSFYLFSEEVVAIYYTSPRQITYDFKELDIQYSGDQITDLSSREWENLKSEVVKRI